MLIIGSILLLLANAVTLRREKSILFNRVAILILLYSNTRIGVFSGLFHSTQRGSQTIFFAFFICIIWERYSRFAHRILVYLFKVSAAPFYPRPLVSGQRTYYTLANLVSKLNPLFYYWFYWWWRMLFDWR